MNRNSINLAIFLAILVVFLPSTFNTRSDYEVQSSEKTIRAGHRPSKQVSELPKFVKRNVV